MIGTDTRQVPAVHRAGTRDWEPVISLMAAAFLRSRLVTHLIGDEHARGQVLRSYFRIIVPHAMTYGRVDVIGNGQAAAIWYRHDDTSLPAIPGYAARLAEATGPHLSRFVDLDAARTRHHPTDRPHQHLTYLAVLPALRAEGLGTRLIEHHHRDLDNTETAAYLEATGPRDSSLFARHGYEPMDPFPAGPGAPHLYPMWRPPQG